MERRQEIEELVYRTCLALDDRDFKAFLDLCDDGFRYKVTAYSPEIRKEMVWLDHDKKGMETLFTQLPRHNSDHSPLRAMPPCTRSRWTARRPRWCRRCRCSAPR
jgi:methanesulfonate monooxygenase small subunit